MASPQRQETVLGIVAVGRPKGLMGMRYDSYNMIVTPTRLVFAYVSPELMKDATRRAREEAKQKGKGLLGQWGAQLGWLGRLHDDYRAMTVDVILNRYPGSFAIPNGQVRRVRFVRTGDEQGGRTSDELILRTGEGKLRFKLLSANLAQVRALLRQTLPGVA